MEFRLLGPLEVVAEGRLIRLDAPEPRALLAILLLRANEPVPSDVRVRGEPNPGGGLITHFHVCACAAAGDGVIRLGKTSVRA